MNIVDMFTPEETTNAVDIVGGKAAGLFRLQKLLPALSKNYASRYGGGVVVPRFFVLPTGYSLSDANIELLRNRAAALGVKKFAVRSSSPFEDGTEHSFDGVYESRLDVGLDNLVNAVRAVQRSSLGKKARRYADDFKLTIDDRMAVIVQEMVKSPQMGIIYSKFPAVNDIVRLIQWDTRYSADGSMTSTVFRRKRTIHGVLYPDQMIETNSGSILTERSLAEISLRIEKNFGSPVRVEYADGDFGAQLLNGRKLHLLQARPIVNVKTPEYRLPEVQDGNLLFGTRWVNGVGDVTAPVVSIGVGEYLSENLPFNKVEQLDEQYKDGYILLCAYLQYWHNDYDECTPHKRAVIAGCKIGRHHDMDVARQKGLLYLGTETVITHAKWRGEGINTGDVLRVVSDGTRGLVYRV
ncbi:TPA: hypothetical protein HA251_04815 [Candidatus Woesearchaeota archaeon]|nr:hypothetical protein [Candidatus Woesearchaeota archaeon]